MNIYARTAIRFGKVLAFLACCGALMYGLCSLPVRVAAAIVIGGGAITMLAICYAEEKDRA